MVEIDARFKLRQKGGLGTSIRIRGEGGIKYSDRRQRGSVDADKEFHRNKGLRYQDAEFVLPNGKKLRGSDAIAELDRGKEYPW